MQTKQRSWKRTALNTGAFTILIGTWACGSSDEGSGPAATGGASGGGGAVGGFAGSSGGMGAAGSSGGIGATSSSGGTGVSGGTGASGGTGVGGATSGTAGGGGLGAAGGAGGGTGGAASGGQGTAGGGAGGAGGGSGGSTGCSPSNGGGLCTVPGQQGICAVGTEECVDGSLTCVQNLSPTAEACDGLDNDCNGVVDDVAVGLGEACDSGVPGMCANGVTACTGGSIVCEQTVTAVAETCNGQDDNCDGTVDEGIAEEACDTGNSGICAAGTTACTSGSIECVQTNTATAESCNGLDDDCDGTVDNPSALDGNFCTTGGLGICNAGTTSCSNGTETCVAAVQPNAVTESCNGLDDDCDGTVDEGDGLTLCAETCGVSSIPNVDGMACTSGACIIGSNCPSGKFDTDGDPCNGCEDTQCTTSHTGTCASPTAINGAGGSTVQTTGQILTLLSSAWFEVSFSAPSKRSSLTPTIELVGGDYQVDIYSDCSTFAECPAGSGQAGDAGGLTTATDGSNITKWSMDYSYQTTQCTTDSSKCSNPDSVTKVLVKITRTSLSGGDCNQFTLTAVE